MSSRDFPGTSWQDDPASEDRHPGYGQTGADSYGPRSASGRPGPFQPGYGPSEPRSANGTHDHDYAGNGNGSSGYGNGRSAISNGGNGRGYASGRPDSHPGRDRAGDYSAGSNGSISAYPGSRNNGSEHQPGASAGYGSRARDSRGSYGGRGSAEPHNGYADGYGAGARGDQPGRRVGSGRHSNRGAASDGYGAPLDDSATWYRRVGRFDTSGFRIAAQRLGSVTRRSARPGYYNPDDDLAQLRDRTARYGAAGPYGRDRIDGPTALRGPSRPGTGRRRAGRGDLNPRGYGGPRRGPDRRDMTILQRLWYGRWWRHWTFKKAGLLFGGVCAFMALALVATFFAILSATKVPINALSEPLDQSSMVYFSNGHEVGCFCTAGRVVLPQWRIKQSKTLVEAILAAEDRNYFGEGGISIPGLARAIKNDLSGGSIQGGSTITEQFVKTYYNPNGIGNLSITQKAKEIFVSIKLANMESKWWILSHYMNAIPLGSGANGVQAAAQTYFHRNAWDLTVPQAAMIAAMIQAPYGYDPTNPTAVPSGLQNSLLDRWVYVLTNMVRDGSVYPGWPAFTQQDMNALVPDPSNPSTALKNFPKIAPTSPVSSWPGYRGYIMQLVANELQANYHINASMAQLGNMGLQIHTTINERLMNALYAAISYERHQIALGLGGPVPPYIHFAAVLEKPGTGKILAFYGGPGYGAKHCNWYKCNVNTILTAVPVGSSFKPYVLTTAVAQGMNVQTSVMNSHSPLCIPPDWNITTQLMLSKQTMNCSIPTGYWLFNEPSENYRQNLSVSAATAASNDPAFEDLIHRTTVQKVINMAQTLGVSSYDVQGLNDLFGNGCLKRNPNCHPGAQNAALGEGDLSAVDQANTFSVLASGGTLVRPHIISSVSESGVGQLSSPLVPIRALQPAVAADADYALSFDTTCLAGGVCGTGVPNAEWNRPMIAKTGTLGDVNNAFAAWFIGAIPQYSLSIGMFTDKPHANPPQILDGLPAVGPWTGGYGGAWPATIWRYFMGQQFSNIPVLPLPTPSYAGTDPIFTKWIMALPPKKKHHRCQLPGQGHHHKFLGGQGQCTGGGVPNPGGGGPNPKGGSPSPHPTLTTAPPSPSPTSRSPNPTKSPTPNPTPTG